MRTITDFKAHIRKGVTVADSGCWEWNGFRDSDGYGVMFAGYKKTRVHRASYAEFVGPIGEGLLVCHHCDNPCCCNPEHLFVGTVRDNVLDMHKKGRAKPPFRGITHCKRGHELSNENVYLHRRVQQSGTWTGVERVCKTCHHAATARYRARKSTANQQVA